MVERADDEVWWRNDKVEDKAKSDGGMRRRTRRRCEGERSEGVEEREENEGRKKESVMDAVRTEGRQ